jgi:hypothetical protein
MLLAPGACLAANMHCVSSSGHASQLHCSHTLSGPSPPLTTSSLIPFVTNLSSVHFAA